MKIIVDKKGRPLYLKTEGEGLPVAEFDLIMDNTEQGPALRLVVPLTTSEAVNLLEQEQDE